MAILPIVRMGHPVLREAARAISEEQLRGTEMQRLIDDMVETMRDAEGVGLAAPQVAAGIQLFVYEATDEDPAASLPLRVVVNPMVEPISGELVYDWEGCLSIPDLRGLAPRHPAVRVRALDRLGAALDYVAEGFEARIVQHEFDHLNGVLFLDRMRDFKSLSFYDEWDEHLRGSDVGEQAAKPE